MGGHVSIQSPSKSHDAARHLSGRARVRGSSRVATEVWAATGFLVVVTTIRRCGTSELPIPPSRAQAWSLRVMGQAGTGQSPDRNPASRSVAGQAYIKEGPVKLA